MQHKYIGDNALLMVFSHFALHAFRLYLASITILLIAIFKTRNNESKKNPSILGKEELNSAREFIVSQGLLMFIIFYTHFHEQNSACADLLYGSVMLQDFTKEFPIA